VTGGAVQEGALPSDLQVPMPRAADLTIQIYDPAAEAPWSARTDSGQAADGFSTRLVIDPSPEHEQASANSIRDFAARSTPVARFENGMKLAVVPPPDVRSSATQTGESQGSGSAAQPMLLADQPGQLGALPVLWYANRAPGEDVHLFVHLVDEQGRVVDQFDVPPALYQDYPTSLWQSGETLVSEIRWQLPASARAGERYQVVVGLYRPTGDTPRNRAFRPDGTPWPDGAIALAQIDVVEPTTGR
jgi:hypothetical protein